MAMADVIGGLPPRNGIVISHEAHRTALRNSGQKDTGWGSLRAVLTGTAKICHDASRKGAITSEHCAHLRRKPLARIGARSATTAAVRGFVYSQPA
jgi:hypothetical protein